MLNEKNEAIKVYEELKDCEKLSIEIKPYREERSLNANAYFWVLAGKLAEKLNSTKEEVYRHHIKETGVFRDITLPEDGICTIEHMWNTYGTGCVWILRRTGVFFCGAITVRAHTTQSR